MYQTNKIHVKAGMKMCDLINENHTLLLLLQHLRIDFTVGDKTVEQICAENEIDIEFFLAVAGLYNGFYPSQNEISAIKDISIIIKYLKNSHRFYLEDKAPEIKDIIKQLQEKTNSKSIGFINDFFNDYFNEVLEHLNYEDQVVFPHFSRLINNKEIDADKKFSVNEYREHHTDIETKLSDLKNLILKHLPVDNFSLRRRFLNNLFELEFDLNIHSEVEEIILLPLIERLERK